ncbi:hypothetical protein ARMGADRAFT_1020179, partial [Armillaria gallica]
MHEGWLYELRDSVISLELGKSRQGRESRQPSWKENISASYKSYTGRSWIFQFRESLGKDISCRKLYRDDIPQYGRIR